MLELAPDYLVRLTTREGTQVSSARHRYYSWVNKHYEVVQANIVPCQVDLLTGLPGEGTPETTAEVNLKTMRLVFSAYDSAFSN